MESSGAGAPQDGGEWRTPRGLNSPFGSLVWRMALPVLGTTVLFALLLAVLVVPALDSAVALRLWTLLLLSALVGAVGAVLYGRRLLSPLNELTRVTRRVAERGDLSTRIEVAGPGEIGRLALALSTLLERLRAVPGPLKDLGSAVGGLSEMARRQQQVVQKQVSGLAEASATAQEMKQTSALAATKAETVVKVAVKAEELSQAGQEALEASVAGLGEIQSQIDSIAGRINDLSERTLKVGEIIESVKDLADQSNVLALNAAIEASKAGEYGKGFAVVAREIRTLADQSIESTRRVREILGEIQAAIRSTVSITEEGKRRIGQGVAQIRASGESLTGLAAIVQDSSQAARQIAASVTQQNAAIAQIFTAIEGLHASTTETLESIRSTEGAVGALSSISGRIAGITGHFQA